MLELRGVSKVFAGGVVALDDVNLKVEQGEFVVIVGASGAGKSTLLRTINGLVRPTRGQVWVDGSDLAELKGAALRQLRRRIGLIFQDFNLVERAPVLTNVLAGRLGYNPTWKTLLGMFAPADVELAFRALEQVGLADKAWQRAGDLSGGQKQRVSIARALVQQPALILADEPVSSLDPPTAYDIMDWFERINREQGITVIINLHDINLACRYGRRLVGMREGRIAHDGAVTAVTDETFVRIYGRKPRHHRGGCRHAAL